MIGGGRMGTGIAQVAAIAGQQVMQYISFESQTQFDEFALFQV